MDNALRKTTIGKHTITTAMLPVITALSLQTRIAVLVSGAASSIDWTTASGYLSSMTEDTKTEKDSSLEMGMLSTIFSSLSSVDPDALSALVIELTAVAFIDGKSGEDHQAVFEDDLLLMWQVAIWVARVNFEPFIKGLMQKPLSQKEAALTIKD